MPQLPELILPVRRSWRLVMLGILFFECLVILGLAIIVPIRDEDRAFVLPSVVVLSIAIFLFVFIGLLPKRNFVRLHKDGFAVCHLYFARSVQWRNVESIEVRRFRMMGEVIALKLTSSRQENGTFLQNLIRLSERLHRLLYGFDVAVASRPYQSAGMELPELFKIYHLVASSHADDR